MWIKVRQYGDEIPYPRTSHTCVTYKDRYLVVVGGETETKYITQSSEQQNFNMQYQNDVSIAPELDQRRSSSQMQKQEKPTSKEHEIVINLDSDVEMNADA